MWDFKETLKINNSQIDHDNWIAKQNMLRMKMVEGKGEVWGGRRAKMGSILRYLWRDADSPITSVLLD